MHVSSDSADETFLMNWRGRASATTLGSGTSNETMMMSKHFRPQKHWRWLNIKEMIYCGIFGASIWNTYTTKKLYTENPIAFNFSFFKSKTSHRPLSSSYERIQTPMRENSCIITSLLITTWIPKRAQRGREKKKSIDWKCIVIMEKRQSGGGRRNGFIGLLMPLLWNVF